MKCMKNLWQKYQLHRFTLSKFFGLFGCISSIMHGRRPRRLSSTHWSVGTRSCPIKFGTQTEKTIHTKGNNFAGFGRRIYALFMFPRGKIKSKTIFPIGITHWLKWPNQIFPKKYFFQKFSFGPPKGSSPEKNLPWGTKGKFLKKKFFLEKSGLAMLTSAQCQ